MSAGPVTWGGPDDRRDLVAGTLRGYRTWHLLPRRVALEPGCLPLTSVTRRHVTWAPALSACCTFDDIAVGTGVASRTAPDHDAPDPTCSCGIYAWYAPADARSYAAEVFGVVEASGVVLMGTHGFRAEHARVVAVASRNRHLASACEAEGIPVYRRRRDLLAAYPPDDVAGLIGETPTPPRRRRPHAFALVVGLSVWLRAALLLVAAGVMSLAAIVATVLISEAVILVLVLAYVRSTRSSPGATAPAAAPPDP